MIWAVGSFTILLVVASVLPFVKEPHGIFRTFDFPRLQIVSIALALLALSLFYFSDNSSWTWITVLLVSVLVLQLSKILRFTPIWKKSSIKFDGDQNEVTSVRLLVCNVKQSNHRHALVNELINNHQPDVAVFVETDKAWVKALQESVEHYEHQMEHALDNTYGMYLVSKLRIFDEKVRFLLNEEVPSFDLMLDTEKGWTFRLITVHPEPPLPNNDTIARDAEIAFVGQLVRHDDNPVVVTGDLNDVAWSRTTRRFLRVSRLLDPREGRGLFNSFDARFFFMRWPLDHLFHSSHFQLITMKRLPFVGSDHFPILYDLALTNDAPHRDVKPAKPSDHEEVAELIEIEKNRDARPVGFDWETKD